jgi:hypothetical protein
VIRRNRAFRAAAIDLVIEPFPARSDGVEVGAGRMRSSRS